MRSNPSFGRRLFRTAALPTAGLAALALAAPTAAFAADPPAAPAQTTAWKDGAFQLDPLGVVSRSDIVLGQPNVAANQSMPLGNGSLGVAAWDANGFTAQLNRSDTMPDRKSPGQVTIPGLSVITHAADFSARLDLTDGVLEESGGGMTAKAWVSTAKDELIVDVTGADPSVAQSASISLWSGRHPAAAVTGTVGTLAETWVDQGEAGASGQTFGSLAAITAGGRGVTTSVTNATQVTTSFTPNADGSFRVVVASPGYDGTQGDPGQLATTLLGSDATAPTTALLSTQDAWWNSFWTHSGLVEMSSADGSADYIENLRTLYLYLEAASMRTGILPGSQAGVADMFSWAQDSQAWTPSSYWLWNQRGEIVANMTSGNYQLNTPIFDLYLNALPGTIAWTQAQMGGLPGACVPETMRFNGNGGDPHNGSCAEASAPLWNALNISSGPEISMYIWQQYLATGDKAFLEKYFPLMKATAQFLLAYQKVGDDGLLHANANAHETQWSVQDPTTDITADATLFPTIVQTAQILGTDTGADKDLVTQMTKAESEIPPYPRTDTATKSQLLNPDYSQSETDAADAAGKDMIAISYEPAAQRRNGENIELEPLFPWNLVSDTDTNLFQLEQRSFDNRPNKGGNDWSFDAVDAARLQRPADVESNLVSLTTGHQVYVNGFADLGSSVGSEPYMEQESTVAVAVDEALAQDYDGVLRFAPAWPSDWDGAGTVYVQGGSKVDVQVQGGQLTTAAIEAGSTQTMKVRSPWPGKAVQVVDGSTGAVVVASTTDTTLNVPVVKGSAYLVEQVSAPTSGLPFAQVTGTANTVAKHLKGVQLGLDAAGTSSTAVVGTVVGTTNQSFGLTEDEKPSDGFDGPTVAGDVGGLTARTSTGGNIYFDIDDTIAHTGDYAATFTFTYYDKGTGSIAVQYDDGTSDPYHGAGSVQLTGSNTWKTATITALGAYFGGGEHSAADFRLRNGADGGQVIVHSVAVSVTGPAVPAVVKFPPAPTITTPKANGTVPTTSSIGGTTEPDGAVKVVEGTTALCTATADDSGAWSCTPASALKQGKHSVTATVTDPTGLVSVASAADTFIASDAPPGTAVVGAVVGTTNAAYGLRQDEDPSNGFDGPTTAGVDGGLSERTSTNSNIYFDVDDAVAHAGFYSATWTIAYYDQGTGSFAVQYDDGSSDPYKSAGNINLTGSNTWKTATVSATDAFFGGQQHSSADFRIRNGGGQVTVHSVALKVSGGGVADQTLFPPTPTITTPADGTTAATGTPKIAGAAEAGATVTVSDGDAAVCTATADASGAFTCTPGTALTAGTHTLAAVSTDPTNLTSDASTSVSYTVSAPATGPQITATSVADGDTVSGTQTFGVTLAGPTSDVSYTYIEVNRGGVWLDDDTTAKAKALGSTNSGLHPRLVVDTTALPDGSYGLKIDAVGTNGKTTEKKLSFTVDNPPTVSFVKPDAGATVSGTVPVTVNLVGPDLQAYNLRVDSAGLQYAYEPEAGDQTFSLDTSTLSNGQHTLLATATDKAGHKTTVTEKVTVDNAVLPAAWSATMVYLGGETVSYQGSSWLAQWWTQNQKPGDPSGPWEEMVSTADGTAVWTPTRVFNTGDEATYQGAVYVAQWWTRNQAPGDPNGPWKKAG